MNSGPNASPNPPTNWILTTCRGRVSHLRESLPSWLDQLPNWSPLVICCDDREAFDYAAGELRLANRGAAIYVEQKDGWFNRLEGLRAGVVALLSGLESNGNSCDAVALEPYYRETSFIGGQVCLFDADTIAIRTTGAALARVGRYDAGFVQGGIRDDLGFLVCHGDALRAAFDMIEPYSFVGYGWDDMPIRVGVWVASGRKFVGVPPCWARKVHSNRERAAHHERGITESSKINGLALGKMIARVVPSSEWTECAAACLPGQRFEIKR